jgi:hypothetical protein
VVVLRDGQEDVIYVEPVVLLDSMHAVQHDPLEQFGVVLDDRYDDRIIVWKVIPRSPAYYAGIRPGDVIVSFHGRRFSRPNQFIQAVQAIDPGEVDMQVLRGQRTRDLQIDVPQFQAQAGRRTAFRPQLDTPAEQRMERREDRLEDRIERREEGRGVVPALRNQLRNADVQVDTTPYGGPNVRIDGNPGIAPGAEVQVNPPGAPNVDVNVQPNNRGRLFPRLRP